MTAQSRPRKGPSCEVEMKMEIKDDGVVMKARNPQTYKIKGGRGGSREGHGLEICICKDDI